MAAAVSVPADSADSAATVAVSVPADSAATDSALADSATAAAMAAAVSAAADATAAWSPWTPNYTGRRGGRGEVRAVPGELLAVLVVAVIRLTLGATRGRIVATCALQGLRPVAAGLSVGLVVSLATARFIEALLFDVAPLDPVVLGGAAVVVLGLGAVACLVPAARALRAPPARTLNAD